MVVAGKVLSIVRRRDAALAAAHPETYFVRASAPLDPGGDMDSWSPDVRIVLPALLGFSSDGVAEWSYDGSSVVQQIAERDEIERVSSVVIPGARSGDTFYGLQLLLAPRGAGPGDFRMFVRSDSITADQYSVEKVVRQVRVALTSAA
ncbi:MAG: hypothetical protein JWP75_3852 [Frondihabitans sp.]|nr:hypothetical protein [Frondihabitans sp.]